MWRNSMAVRILINESRGECLELVKLALPLPNPRLAELDEYLTNSHIFYID
jgi:hypothetical protein